MRHTVTRTLPLACGLAFLFSGCGGPTSPPSYRAEDGFKITPPAGWPMRERAGAISAHASHKARPLPLPPLGKSEKLLVRYDRMTSSAPAWLRVSTDASSEKPLTDQVAAHAPAADWKREADVETLEVAGLPAARVAFKGRWQGQDFLNETLIVQKQDRLYLLSATFPAADTEAREAVRKASLTASWQ